MKTNHAHADEPAANHENPALNESPALPSIDAVLASPSTSDWLKNTLRSALRRDCCDAAADAGLLSVLLSDRADGLLGLKGGGK